MRDVVLGIDLGTTNSVVAVADAVNARVLTDLDGERLIPSAVSFHPNGTVLVGAVARERRLLDARNTVYAFKRLMGRPFSSPQVKRASMRFAFQLVEAANEGVEVAIRDARWSIPEVAAYVLRECADRAERALGFRCRRAVVTVPANFNELQRSATQAAGAIAGLEVVRIINEPTAAALAYGFGANRSERVAVYDLGGGTFDITILETEGDVFEVIGTAGDTFLGGDDIDLLLAEEMCNRFLAEHRWDPRQERQAFERLRAAAEWAKCMLSSQDRVEVRVPELTFGERGLPLDLATTIARTELEMLISPLVDQSITVCQDALRVAGVQASDIDRVVLVGGSTRIPLVQRQVGEFFAQPPRMDLDPDLVVALGAAIQGHALVGKPRQTLDYSRVPNADQVEAVRRQKELAREERPNQPAFVPVPLGAMDLRKFGSNILQRATGDRPVTSPSLAPPPGEVAVPEVEIDPLQPDPTRRSSRPPAPGKRLSYLDDLTPLPQPLPQSPPIGPPVSGIPDALGLSTPTPEGRKNTSPYSENPVPKLRPRSSTDPYGQQPAVPIGALPAAAVIAQSIAPGGEDHLSPLRPRQSTVPLGGDVAPLLMDVTPHSLGVQTAGGHAEALIRRNSPIPTEQTRVFSTAADFQELVEVAVCQGESRVFGENQSLGAVQLLGLRKARRGEVKIEVTFMLDANGTLDVRAVDVDTNKTQSFRINLVGGFTAGQIEQMRSRQES